MIRALIFDLDQTLLDRQRSLLKFLNWQVQLLGFKQPEQKKWITRFIELDHQGRVWKDMVYTQLVLEFELNPMKAEQLLT